MTGCQEALHTLEVLGHDNAYLHPTCLSEQRTSHLAQLDLNPFCDCDYPRVSQRCCVLGGLCLALSMQSTEGCCLKASLLLQMSAATAAGIRCRVEGGENDSTPPIQVQAELDAVLEGVTVAQ